MFGMGNSRVLVLSVLIPVALTVVFYFTLAHRTTKLVKNHLCHATATMSHDMYISDMEERERKAYLLDNQSERLAHDLRKDVRILCFIPTMARNLGTKALAVKETWAPRCNKALFFTPEADADFPTLSLGDDFQDSFQALPEKTIKALAYIHQHYLDDADWFLKADDDTYVIVENLRYLLSHHDPTTPLYFGHHYKENVQQGYMSGGAGYVLSKAALRLVVENGLRNRSMTACHRAAGAEDVVLGRCLESLGVAPSESVDVTGRETFHPFNAATHFYGTYPDWYHEYKRSETKSGKDCCSEFSTTYHFVDHITMRVYHQLIYHTQVYGQLQGLPKYAHFKQTQRVTGT